MSHYVAAYTDSDFLIVCEHQHKTVTSATACDPAAGSYVIAVRRGRLSELTDKEEQEFQLARYGRAPEKRTAKDPGLAPNPVPENGF